MKQVAEIYGVSRQRIKQLIDRYLPEWKDECGFVVLHKERAKAYKDRWGPDGRLDTELYKVCRQKFRQKKANAVHTGWKWTITFGEIEWPTHCPILGIELDYFLESRAENSPSFDQIDPGKGYVPGNVQIISWRANRIKNDGTAEEHRKIADYLETLQR